MENRFDVIVIGGGQSGLAMGYYLRRTGLSYVILDNQNEPGGAWLHTWNSLRMFSPAQWSSLPGMIMAGGSDYYPTRDVTIGTEGAALQKLIRGESYKESILRIGAFDRSLEYQ